MTGMRPQSAKLAPLVPARRGAKAAAIGREASVRRPRPRIGLAALIVAATAAAVLALSGLVAQVLTSAYRDALVQAERRTQDFADILSEHTRLTFEDASLTIDVALQARRRLIAEGRWWPTSEQPHETLRSLLRTSSAMTQLAFVDADGNRLYSGREANAQPLNVSARRHFTVHRERNDVGLFIGPPSQSDVTGRYNIPISRRVDADDGSFAGIFTGVIEPSYFADSYRATTRRQHVVIRLALLDGTILVREPSPREVTGTVNPSSTIIAHLAKAPDGTFSAISPYDGVDRIVSYRTVGRLPLVLHVSMAKDDALVEWRRISALALTFCLALDAALFGAAWLLIHRLRQRARREREQAEAKDRLRQAQKHQALGTLVGGIAHEINNALVPIIALGEMLQETLPEGGFEHEGMGQILLSSRQIEGLVKRVLAFSREEDGASGSTDVPELLASLGRELRERLPKHIQLSARSEAGVDTIQISREKLRQIIGDLVTNAADAIGTRHGRIEIVAQGVQARPGDATRAQRDHVRLTVRDDGPGIPAAVRERLFEPFFTTKEVGKGVGLGLYAARRLVIDAGGHIAVESTPGEGACFSIHLPRAPSHGLQHAA